jgi:Tfp pilus assembly protein PilF
MKTLKLTWVVILSIFLLAGCAIFSEDTQLANKGYDELVKQNYQGAEAYFKKALEINPENPYALLNMGVVYQNTGRIEKARETYQKVIALNPSARAAKSTKSDKEGKLLVDIARENLAGL